MVGFVNFGVEDFLYCFKGYVGEEIVVEDYGIVGNIGNGRVG